jgi:hypothetical protein
MNVYVRLFLKLFSYLSELAQMVYVVAGLYIHCWCCCLEIWTSFVDWAELIEPRPEGEDKIQSPKRCPK